MGGAWKVAYADFVTAMMAFFLLMWILNMVPPETKVGLAAYFSGERNFDSSSTSPISNNPFIQNTDKIDTRELKINETERSHYAIAQKLKMVMADAIPQSSSGLSADDLGVQLRVNSDALFQKGSIRITPAAEKVFKGVLDVLKEYNLYLVVRGHADSDEANSAAYPSAWELSGARAATVLHYLVNHNVKASRLRGVCYGDTRPLKPGFDEGSKSVNRRVEFFFHRPEVMSYSVVY